MKYLKNTMLYKMLKHLFNGVIIPVYEAEKGNRKLSRIAAKKSISKNIKVGFVVQMPEIWDKLDTLYEAMVIANDFEPWLIIVPGYDFKNQRISLEYGAEKKYFLERYPNAKVLYAIQSSTVISLNEEEFDYIFLQRCYELYLPIELHTSTIIEYCKTCYIPYCFHALRDKKAYYRTSFFSNLYLFFCSSEEQLEQSKTHSKRSNVYLGYPSNDRYKVVDTFKYENILWTPRWHDDAETGGSSFLKYKDKIFDLKEKLRVSLTIRPHPLTFDNAIKEKKMTEEDVHRYKAKLADFHIKFDSNSTIDKTFLETDILITDFSSIIINFFLTGKPIIYCGDPAIKFNSVYQRIMETSYIADTWEDIEKYVYELTCGNDFLKEKRFLAIETMKDKTNTVNSIIDYLRSDFRLSK